VNGLNDQHSTIAILHIGGNGSAEPRVADWVTRNASDVQHGAALASPRADDATIVRVNQDGRHHIPCPRPVDAQLASLKKTSEWERAAFIKKGGWDTLSGLKETVTGAANLCAQLLVTEKVPAAKTAAASG
jgi:hypothetical protein